MTGDPPFRRIADAIHARIAAGDLRPGDRAPSTRQITREWGVAMATATKALTTLHREGVLAPVRGVGMIVQPPRPARASARPAPGLTRDRVVEAGIAVADADGLDALSMRRVAAELGTGTMSLYRHVQDRDELVRNMSGTVFAEAPLPEPPPEDWRACLELAARTQWDLYGRHPWLAAVVSFTRPPLVPAMMAHTAWTVRALRGRGLSAGDLTREVITLSTFVRGLAISRAEEVTAVRATGRSLDQWWASRASAFTEALDTGALSALAHLRQDASADFEALFAYGLARHLNGLAALLR